MAQKFYNLEQTAEVLGLNPAEVHKLRERNELHGYRDGQNWKFKVEEVENKLADLIRSRDSGSDDQPDEETEDVLLSEVELGESGTSSGSVIGGLEHGAGSAAESDLQLVESVVDIEGGADMFLMPSRFEPCGLNQLYSLRYGTVPIVHRVGGLADTVIDADAAQLAAGKATGITFDAETPKALLSAVGRAVALFQEPATWKRIVVTGMRQSFSWRTSAKRYLHLYGSLVPDADTTEVV